MNQQQESIYQKKQWFVFDHDHHIGPFGINEIIELYKANRVDSDDLVWRKGQEDWLKMRDCDELYVQLEPLDSAIRDIEKRNIKNIYTRAQVDISQDAQEIYDFIQSDSHLEPPPHPDILEQELDDFFNSDKEEQIEKEPDIQNITLPEINEQFFHPVKEETISSDEIFAKNNEIPLEIQLPTDQIIEEEKVEVLKESSFLYFSRFVLGCTTIILFCGIILYFLIMNKATVPEGLNGIGQVDYMKMKKIINDKGEDLQVHFALNTQSEGIWMALNRPGPMSLRVILHSIRKKSLSQSPVVVESLGLLQNGRVEFDELTFHEGTQIVPGYYQAEIIARDLGILGKWNELIKEKNTVHKIETTAFLSPFSKSEFNVKLAKFWDDIILKEKGPLQDILQKYQTLSSLVEQMYTKYKFELKKVKAPSEVIRFKAYYLNQIRPVLQNITLSNAKIKISLQNVRADTATEYQNLVDIGREFGELAMDMIVKTERNSKFDEKNKTKLLSEFRIKYENITSQITNNHIRLKKVIEAI
ncbi:MAG: DUF4339 domain-containing protein [Halobacteriovoraceae bacterium]|nr:DUF4339 domain-containing protein [Halobacteriovoraceae bacterium]